MFKYFWDCRASCGKNLNLNQGFSNEIKELSTLQAKILLWLTQINVQDWLVQS